MNDVYNMMGMLVEEFQISVDEMTVLVDASHGAAQKDPEKPTGKNIKRHLTRLVAASQPGDILFLHFSGHGTQVLPVSHVRTVVSVLSCHSNEQIA